jgi:flagellar biosynthesis/type III secretory pathway chaperone
LRKEKEKLSGGAVHANSLYEVVTQNALLGHVYSSAEREEIDRFMRQRERLLKRLARVDRDLATIQTDGLVIQRHHAG